MMSDPSWVVIVTYREWLNWAAYGSLRIGGRRTKYKPKLCMEDFMALMDKAPDVSRLEDQAYLVAHLRSTPKNSGGGKMTSLDLVTGFHPLSARGHALLKGDAEKALIKLGKPVFEGLWRRWVDTNRKGLRAQSARNLVQACCLPDFDIKAVIGFELLLDPTGALRKRASTPDAAKAFEKKIKRGRKLILQPAYGWWMSLMAFKKLLPAEKADEFSAEARTFIEHSFTELQSIDLLMRPVTSWVAAIDFSARMADRFSTESSLPLTLLAVIYHYQHVVAELGMIDYPALEEDLRFLSNELGEQGIERASLATYCIGWHLDSATATALCCAAVSKRSRTVLDIDRVPRISLLSEQGKVRGQESANDECMSRYTSGSRSVGGAAA